MRWHSWSKYFLISERIIQNRSKFEFAEYEVAQLNYVVLNFWKNPPNGSKLECGGFFKLIATGVFWQTELIKNWHLKNSGCITLSIFPLQFNTLPIFLTILPASQVPNFVKFTHSHSGRPKKAWQFWKYFTYKGIFWKTFEGEMLIISLTTTLLQIFCELLLYCQVIPKNVRVADDTF